MQHIGINITDYYKSLNKNGTLIDDPDHWMYTTPVKQISQYQKSHEVISLFKLPPDRENEHLYVSCLDIMNFARFKLQCQHYDKLETIGGQEFPDDEFRKV